MSLNNSFMEFIKILRKNDNDYPNNVNSNNLHNHKYYEIMTLCHQNKNYIEKWIEYLNREKFDCNMEYNAKNVGMGK